MEQKTCQVIHDIRVTSSNSNLSIDSMSDRSAAYFLLTLPKYLCNLYNLSCSCEENLEERLLKRTHQ